MYKKAEFLKQTTDQYGGTVLPAIYNTGNHKEYLIDIGQPCIVIVPTINTATFRDLVTEGPKFLSLMGWNKMKDFKVSVEDVQKSGISNREVWSKIVEYFNNLGQSVIHSMFPFYNYKGRSDPNSLVLRIKISSFSAFFDKPLFYEDPTGLIKNVSNFESLRSLDINSLLKDHRYLCFMWEKLSEKLVSEKAYGQLFSLISGLKNSYPYNRVFYSRDVGIPTPFLLDTMCVSFYSLDDVMPIFDFRSLSKSFCVEIILTNSTLSPNAIHGGIGSVVFSLLFSAGADNIFEIDGENIKNEDNRTVKDILMAIENVIHASVSQRGTKPNKKSKSLTAMEDLICVAS